MLFMLSKLNAKGIQWDFHLQVGAPIPFRLQDDHDETLARPSFEMIMNIIESNGTWYYLSVLIDSELHTKK